MMAGWETAEVVLLSAEKWTEIFPSTSASSLEEARLFSLLYGI